MHPVLLLLHAPSAAIDCCSDAPSDIACDVAIVTGSTKPWGALEVTLSMDKSHGDQAERDLPDIPGGVFFSKPKEQYHVVYAVASDGNHHHQRVVGCAFYDFVTPVLPERGSQLYVYVPHMYVMQNLLDEGTEGMNWNPFQVAKCLLQYIAGAIMPTQHSIVLACHGNAASPPPPPWVNDVRKALDIIEIIKPEVFNLTIPDHDEKVTTLWGQGRTFKKISARLIANLRKDAVYKCGCRRGPDRAVPPLKQREEDIIQATPLSPPQLGASPALIPTHHAHDMPPHTDAPSPPCDDCDMTQMLPT